MSFRIVRNDITKMNTEAIVNTANDQPAVGTGCDHAVYRAAGYDELLAYRKENIGAVKAGDVFLTPGFGLPAKYIIHAVSPLYMDGRRGEEEKLRACYRKSLALADEKGIKSIAFPLISTGGFGYPREEGMRIAVDEIRAFLLSHEMDICLVVFDEKSAQMGKHIDPDLEAYIDQSYVDERWDAEYGDGRHDGLPEGFGSRCGRRDNGIGKMIGNVPACPAPVPDRTAGKRARPKKPGFSIFRKEGRKASMPEKPMMPASMAAPAAFPMDEETDAVLSDDFDAIEELEAKLAERMKHMSDTFSQYLLYLIGSKGMENAEVYKKAIVDKKVFSKIKNNPNYHPQKMTALCLCVGARLNLDETRDLLARAGYALSPCDKTDIIFSYFIEHGIYDMIELDIQLEEHGLPCIIS